jgi:hypothetical protein
MDRRGLSTLAVTFLASGCALVGGVDGDFKPLAEATGGAPSATPTCVDGVTNGAETDTDCGGDACSRCAVDQKCGADADCESAYCAGGKCAKPSCTDGIKNGAETGKDCGGGFCEPCKDGEACGAPAQCESLVCTGGKCAPPSCTDGVENGAETAVDCGPSCPCDAGQPCVADAGCKSLLCMGGFCQPANCNDGVPNGTESGVDCGGACPPCADLANCHAGTDCASGVCSTSKCQPPTCGDGVKNGTETGKDCGGTCATPCAVGAGCKTAADCASGVCLLDTCVATTCIDGVKNGGEIAIDCGGGCLCDTGAKCTSAADCKSGVCAGTFCQAPACSDMVKNGGETDKDCGGACPPCAIGKACAAGSDCASGVCAAGACAAPTCMDATRNGAETDVDCGGPVCGKCPPQGGCAVDGDCKGGACIAGTCAPTCSDGVKNQGETDVDCGGPMCGPCVLGKVCAAGSDCASGRCSAGACVAASCSDGLKDGNESDVDCGGPCAPCANAKKCVFDEDCASGGCDTGKCGPWVRAYGTTTAVSPALGVEPDGTVVGSQVVTFPGTDFGGGTMSPPNGQGSRLLLFALSPAGQYLWSKFTETTCEARPLSVRSDKAGNIVTVGGALGSSCDFGGGPLAASPSDLFVAKYSSAGSYVWAKAFGPPQVSGPPGALAMAPNGDVIATGYFAGPTVTFGAFTLTNPTPGSGEGFVVRLAGADGTPLWARAFGAAPNNGGGEAVAVDPAGNVFVTGTFDTSVDFGPPCAPLVGGFQGFVAKLSSTGTCIWAKAAGSTYVESVAADANGDVVVVGQSGNAVTLGGSNVGGPAGIWTVKLHGNDGSYIWANSVPPLFTAPTLPRLALDAAGNAILAGTFPAGTNPDFGGGALMNQGGNDVFVAVYAAASGSHLFSKGFGAAGDDYGLDLAVSPLTGSVLVTGTFQGSVNFGTGPIVAPTPTSVFVLSLGPLP